VENAENRTPVLETRSIEKSFPNGSDWIRVLQGVDFTLESGQAVAIQGESGSGKTTFLNIISGLETFEEGQLFWDGEAIVNQSSSALAAKRASQMGLIFQAYYLLPELNVLDNVIMATRLLGAPRPNDRERAGKLITRVGLHDRMNFSVEKLSGGERQRVAIARALMIRPNLILADEPTGNLDEHTGDSVIELLLEIAREEGTSLILVTHNNGHALKTEKRYQLHLGKLEIITDEL
tara:strand:- start:65 stop:772 length:708 start_codon:yes stop_codon:yes gene_type:complete